MKYILALCACLIFGSCSSPTAPYNPSEFHGLLGAWKSDRPLVDSHYIVMTMYEELDNHGFLGDYRTELYYDSDTTVGIGADNGYGGFSIGFFKNGQTLYMNNPNLSSSADSLVCGWRINGEEMGFTGTTHGDSLRCSFFRETQPKASEPFSFVRISYPDSVRKP